MKIIQISDFHITGDSTLAKFSKKISRLTDAIKSEVSEDELLIILVCGDIIDKGDASGYPVATDILNEIKLGLANYRVQFEFTPGNHEIKLNCGSKFSDFGRFIEIFGAQQTNISNSSVIVKNYENINFVIMNSCYKFDPAHGEVNLSELEDITNSVIGPIVWVAHHTLFSRYNEDASSIRNAHDLIKIIQNKNSIAFIHGHTHGYSNITIGEKCKVIGVGSLFKVVEDVNNQFNILAISGTQLLKIDNFCYRADTDLFEKQSLYVNQRINNFEGSSLIDLYAESVANVKANGVINNFNFYLSCQIDGFKRDVENLFNDQIELANLWMKDQLPDCMYYNHAQYMNKGSKPGLSYVIDELSVKSTSSRAIIPLINIVDVVDSGDNHLPSLDIVQFGFDNESRNRLYVSVYLRALEVNHFLKINICEMYHLIKRVTDKFRSVQNIDLNITAFRAQYKEKFGCFMKSKIDSISPHQLTALVMRRDVDTIISMLTEKKELAETVVNADGIKSFVEALVVTTNECYYDFYTKDMLDKSRRLVDLYETLIKERGRTSIHADIAQTESEISSHLDEVITSLRHIRGKHENH